MKIYLLQFHRSCATTLTWDKICHAGGWNGSTNFFHSSLTYLCFGTTILKFLTCCFAKNSFVWHIWQMQWNHQIQDNDAGSLKVVILTIYTMFKTWEECFIWFKTRGAEAQRRRGAEAQRRRGAEAQRRRRMVTKCKQSHELVAIIFLQLNRICTVFIWSSQSLCIILLINIRTHNVFTSLATIAR